MKQVTTVSYFKYKGMKFFNIILFSFYLFFLYQLV